MFPIASPPAAPPPSPPPSDSDLDVNSVQSSPAVVEEDEHGTPRYTPGVSSYQKATAGNAAAVPTITNYGLSPQHLLYSSSGGGVSGPGNSSGYNNSGQYQDNHHEHEASSSSKNGQKGGRVRGDVTLRPNTGNTNQESGAAFGSLRENASALRWITIATTITAIFWEGFAFPMRILSTTAFVEPSKVVLGAYLGVFCVLILGVEMNAPLRDNFGFLYNPMTRGMVLLMMSSMCIGILKSWWESLLGIAFVLVGIGYVYLYIRYPEYRRWQDYNENRPSAWQDLRHWMNSERGRSSVWANPDGDHDPFAWTLSQQSSSEARSLLHNV
jgi:COPI associated protein